MIKKEDSLYLPVSYLINDLLDELNMSQKQLALRLGASEKHISKLLNNEVQLSIEMAMKLEMVLGIKAQTLLETDNKFRLHLLSDSELYELSDEKASEYLEEYHYDELIKMNYLSSREKKIERIKSIAKLLRINSLEAFDVVYYNEASNLTFEREPYDLKLAFLTLNKAKDSLANMPIIPQFDKKNQNALFKELRKRVEKYETNAYKTVEAILNSYGIYFIAVPDFPYSNIRGFVIHKHDNPVIIISRNIRTFDGFFFSLLHLLGHLYSHIKKKNWLIDLNERDYEIAEFEASNFANNVLIERKDYQRFLATKNFSEENILNMAKFFKIHPSFLATRLNKDGYLEVKKMEVFRRYIEEEN